MLLSFCLAFTNHDSLLARYIMYPFTDVSSITVNTDGLKHLGLLSVNVLGSDIHKVHNVVVWFLLGNSPASEFYMLTFRNTLSVPSSQAGKHEE
jgi:hypothetical protein